MGFTHPDFTIIKELGRGASGAVYLAVQNQLNRRVAIKVFSDSLARHTGAQRFLREARILAQLQHPNIVPVYDLVALPDKRGFLMSMAYIDGGSLRDKAESITLLQAHSVVSQIAGALGFAFESGFVHRDVKPENILFQNDCALLADFGIARAVTSETGLTQVGSVLGTAEYMSPELVTGSSDVDLSSDLYSLAIVLYVLLAGRPPYKAGSALSTQMLHLTAEVPALPEAFKCYQPFMQKWLAKNKTERPPNAMAFIADLNNALSKFQLRRDIALSELRANQEDEVSAVVRNTSIRNISDRNSSDRNISDRGSRHGAIGHQQSSPTQVTGLAQSQDGRAASPEKVTQRTGRDTGNAEPLCQTKRPWVGLTPAVVATCVMALLAVGVLVYRQVKQPTVPAVDLIVDSDDLDVLVRRNRALRLLIANLEPDAHARVSEVHVPEVRISETSAAKDSTSDQHHDKSYDKDYDKSYDQGYASLRQAESSGEADIASRIQYLRSSNAAFQQYVDNRATYRKEMLLAELMAVIDEARRKRTVGLARVDLSELDRFEDNSPESLRRHLGVLRILLSQYKKGVRENPRAYTLGSSEQEIDKAYRLCQAYSEDCKRSSYQGELEREVTIAPFEMDIYEVDVVGFGRYACQLNIVTVAEQRNETSVTHVDGLLSYPVNRRFWYNQFPQDGRRYPVSHVTVQDAKRYCRSLNKRLPTEAEWEYTARGIARRSYPWGEQWQPNSRHHGVVPQDSNLAIASFSSAVSGHYDLTGSVAEWTSTVEEGVEGPSDGKPDEHRQTGIVKGGSRFDNNPANLRLAMRRYLPVNFSGDSIGFRCAKSVDAWADQD